MRCASRLTSAWMSLGIVAVLACGLSAFPTLAMAQGTQGQDAVYSAPGTCCKGSSSFIDASQFINANNNNICSAIYSILQPSTYSPAVIDARGISGTTARKCAPGRTPWNNGTTFLNKPSTVLLPAGTIVIPTTWVLPNYTRLIGEGDTIASSGSTPGTTIQACTQSTNNCSFTGTDMVDLGNSILCPVFGGIATCNSVSVEHVTLDGQGQSINGIVNTNAQTGSRVGWPTFTFFVKVGTHAAGVGIFILASPHWLIRTAPSSSKA
jgi:hypothetical protein